MCIDPYAYSFNFFFLHPHTVHSFVLVVIFLVILKNYRAILVGIENADNNDVDGDGDGSEHCNNNNYNEI